MPRKPLDQQHSCLAANPSGVLFPDGALAASTSRRRSAAKSKCRLGGNSEMAADQNTGPGVVFFKQPRVCVRSLDSVSCGRVMQPSPVQRASRRLCG